MREAPIHAERFLYVQNSTMNSPSEREKRNKTQLAQSKQAGLAPPNHSPGTPSSPRGPAGNFSFRSVLSELY